MTDWNVSGWIGSESYITRDATSPKAPTKSDERLRTTVTIHAGSNPALPTMFIYIKLFSLNSIKKKIMELEPISSTKWDLGFNNAYILNRNFMAKWGELTCLFDVDCYKSFRTVRYNSWTPPESEIVEEYYSVLFKEAWTDTKNIDLPAWIQYKLEEQLLKILKDEY